MNVAKKSFIRLFLAIGLTCSLAHAAYADTINALSTFKDQLIAIANMLGSKIEFQETAQRLEIQKKFVQQTKAVTSEGQELAKFLEEKTELPPEIAKISVDYLEQPYQLKGILDGTLNNNEGVRRFLPLPNAQLAVASDDSITIWDVNTKQIIHKITTSTPRFLALLPNGTFASATRSGTITIWDIKTGTMLRTFGTRSNGELLTALAVTPENTILTAADVSTRQTENLAVTEWSPSSGELLAKKMLSGACYDLAVLSNGRRVCTDPSHNLLTFDSKTNSLKTFSAQPSYPDSFAILPGNEIKLALAIDDVIVIVNSDGQRITPSTKPEGNPGIRQIIALPDGRVASINNTNNNVIIWKLNQKTNVLERQHTLTDREHPEAITNLTVLKDGRLVSGDDNGVINIWR